MESKEKALRLEQVGTALRTFFTTKLASVVAQVGSNTDKIEELEAEIEKLKGKLGVVEMFPDDSEESVGIKNVLADDVAQSMTAYMVADDETESVRAQ